LAGNESTVSGFSFSNRSDNRGGVSRKERINRSQRGAAKSRAGFPNGSERKTIQPQEGGAPRGLRYWAKSNDYRRREHMPSADRAARRTYVRSGGFRITERGAFRLAGNESTVSGFSFSNRSENRGGVSQEERINRSQRGAAKSRAGFPNGPNNGAGRLPVDRERINRQTFFLVDSARKELTAHEENKQSPCAWADIRCGPLIDEPKRTDHHNGRAASQPRHGTPPTTKDKDDGTMAVE
jgi:hypothetical protein